MLLGSSSSIYVSLSDRAKLVPSLSSSAPFLNSLNGSYGVRFFSKRNVGCGVVAKVSKEAENQPILGIAFEPFEEVKKELLVIPSVPHASLARQMYTDQCEAALNAQINVEYSVSYVYHAMYAYFDRDNVALKGLAKVQLQSMLMPFSEFDHSEKGDALYAMELALSLERLNNEKLLNLHSLANENNDVQFVDFLESEFLVGQVEDIKKISEYVAQLRRMGKGHGVWHFDQMLLNGGVAA
ncbi:Ferritin-3, chloroplastic [Glycine max]|nr:Ferritin-3, chloroplastic [Glycine max]